MGLLDTVQQAAAEIQSFLDDPFGVKKEPINALRGDDFTQGFIIVELDPPKERVSLVKNLMPEVPFTFGGELRRIKEYYPGSAEPVVHILGTQESDLVIRGRLYDKRFATENSNGQNQYGIAEQLQRQLDEFRIRGNLLRLELGEWQRFAFMTNTEFQMTKLGDIRYVLTFDLVGFNPPLRTRFTGRTKELPNATNAELTALLDEYNSTFQQLPDPIPQSLADIINDAVNDVAEVIADVTGFIDDVVSAAEDVSNAVTRAVGLITVAQNAIINARRRLGRIGFQLEGAADTIDRAAAGFAAGFRDPRAEPLAGYPVVTRYATYSTVSSVHNFYTNFTSLLDQLKASFQAIAVTIPLARHLVKDGDTLQKLAFQFYQDDQEWQRIYDHNSLNSTDLIPGEILEIPRIPGGGDDT